MKTPHLLLAAAAGLLSAAVFAQNPGAGPSMASAFDSLDADKDSRISRTEAQASPAVSQSFAEADADGDSAITREEFMASFTMRTPESAPPASPEPPAGNPPADNPPR